MRRLSAEHARHLAGLPLEFEGLKIMREDEQIHFGSQMHLRMPQWPFDEMPKRYNMFEYVRRRYWRCVGSFAP